MNKHTVTRIAKRALWHAQNGRCVVCGCPLSRKFGSPKLTFDHVWPKSRASIDDHAEGNLLLAHDACNNSKADSQPTGCERIWLFVVNRRMGIPEGEYSYWDGLA